MSDERFDKLDAKFDEKFDGLTKEVADFRVSVEHRLTKAEERAGWIGAITGLLSSLGLAYFKGKTGP